MAARLGGTLRSFLQAQRWWLWWGLFWLLALTLPYLAAAAHPLPWHAWSGALVNYDDFPLNLEKIRQGAAGWWLWRDDFGPRDPGPAYGYPMLILGGHLAGLLGWPPAVGWHVIRLSGAAAYAAAAALLAVTTLRSRAAARLGWLLALWGSGASVWLAVVAAAIPAARTLVGRPWDLVLVNVSSYPDLLSSATDGWAGAGLCLAVAAWVRWLTATSGRWRWALAGGAGMLVAGAQYPQMAAWMALILALASLGRGAAPRLRSLSLAGWLAGAGLPLAVALASVAASPWLVTWQQQSRINLPDELGAWLSHGLVGLLAALGLLLWLRRGRPAELAPVVLWALVAQLALALAPWPFSRSWVAIAVPIGLLAAHGLVRGVLPWLTARWAGLRRPRLRGSLARLLLVAAAPTCLAVAGTGLVPYNPAIASVDPAYVPAGVPAVLGVLGSRGPGVVAAAPDSGLWVPFAGPPGVVRPLVAHRSETLGYSDLLAQEQSFLRAWRAGFPGRPPWVPMYARWVLWGPFEAALAGVPGQGPPRGGLPGYVLIARSGDVWLFERGP